MFGQISANDRNSDAKLGQRKHWPPNELVPQGRRESETRIPRRIRGTEAKRPQGRKVKRNNALEGNRGTPIRNASEPSSKYFLAESSDKDISAQYLRPNIHPIYQKPLHSTFSAVFMAEISAPFMRRQK